tara:strand:- start:8405 stop:13417 length:5013 start_codon:yes stop_codon:yes gene_type:complete
MSSRKVAFSMLLLLLVQVIVPIIPADATTGRTSPDFNVSVLTLSSGGSIDEAGQIKLSPGDHIIRVVVSNDGPAAGSAVLNIVHQASASSGETPVTSIDLGSIGAASSSNPVLINWTATSGDGQTLFARIVSAADSDNSDNERSIDFDVTMYHKGTVLGHNVPGPTPGFTDLRLDHSIHTYEATVRNDGVMDISAVYELNFTDDSNPSNQVSYWSNTLILEPGSLLYASSGATLSVSFDASTMLGSWTMASKIHFNGTLWTNMIVADVITVTFSDFIVDLSTPGDRAIEPGATTTLTWIVSNIGNTDTLTIELGSDLGWHDNGQNGNLISINGGESTSIVVPVTVPANAVKPTLENVYLNLTSNSASPYTARSVAHVMVGDQYQAEVIAPAGPVTVTPAQTSSLLFTIENSGNVPAAFDIATGLSAAAENWLIESSVTRTDVIPVGANVSVSIQVTPAPISSPLDSGERNAAGDSLYAWLSATPVEGGIPALNSTQLVIRAVIAVDPGPETDQIILTPQDIIDANGSGGIDRILSLSVEVRHNLGGTVTGGVDANITTSAALFTPANSGGNNEAARWITNVTPNSVSGLEVGEIFQSWLAIDGPGDELPLAGELVVPVTATPILTASQQANGVLASSVTRNISIIVPSVIDGEIITEGPLDADVGNLTNFTIKLANTGNDLSSYRLVIEDDLPELWSASIETSNTNNPSIVSNLTPSMADHPITGNAHISNVTLKVTTDPQAPADTLQPLTVRVEDRDTGEILSLNTLLIRVEESINFELQPTNHTVDLSPYETPLTRVYINNTGNVATTFLVWLDNSQSNDVDFSLESATEVVVAPGYSDSVKIRLTPDTEASADESHMTTLWVEAIGGMNKSASIVANISADHHLTIEVQPLISVTPGVNETIDVLFTNTGNLEEFLNVTAVIEGGWESSWVESQMILPINGSLQNDLTVTIPALGGNFSLANGDTHNVTISLYHTNNGVFLSSRTITLVVAPLFLVEFEDWPSEVNYHRQWVRDWKVTVTNVGNKDVTADLEYEVLRPGLEINSLSWEVIQPAPPSLILPVGQSVDLTFSVEAKEFEPDLYLEALLRLTLTPNDSDVNGSAIAETALKMSRLFAYKDYQISLPPEDNSNLTEEIIWSHIPGLAGETPVEYMIELCDAQRRVNLTQLGLSEDDFEWSFAIDLNGENQELNLNNNCDGSSHSVISLPLRPAWETNNPLLVIVDTPNRPNILKNDGYDLTFRLYHPGEHNGFTEYTEETFSFYFTTKASLNISKFEYDDDSMSEGSVSTISATIGNAGTSIAIGVISTLSCEGVTVSNPVVEHGLVTAGESIPVVWEVESDNLDWWAQSTDVSCELLLSGTAWNGTPLDSRSVTRETTVSSWSPGVTVSFIAVLVLLGASVGLLRLVGQNDKFRLAAIYTGVLALGFAFHLMDLISSEWGGPAILLIAALWVWIMTWKSTEEFQLIHEDYQRARKGISTLYSDHFDVLSNSKRQLVIILAMPILGMIGVILGFPPQINPDSTNMFSLIAYLAIVIVGVTFLIWNANRMYGSLYGRLTEVEVQASRIERDLGDPARLLTELASDGLDISSIISQPKSTVAAPGNASSSAVIDWDEDVGLLMEDDQSPPESITLELESDETPSDEGTEEDEQAVSDIDVEDLFEDEEVSNDD